MPSNSKTVNLNLQDGILYNDATGEIVTKDYMQKNSSTSFKINNVEDDLATGIAINTYQRTSLDFLDDLKDFKQLGSIYKQIEICNKMFFHESIVSTALDIMIDFTINPFEIEGMPDEMEAVTKHWVDNINMEENRYEPFGLDTLSVDMAFEWFISGNIFPWEVWNNVDFEGRVYALPTKIKLLNPRSIRIDKVSAAVGDPKYFLSPGLVNESLTLDDLISAPDIKNATNPLFRNVDLESNSMELPNNFLSHIKRRARHYDVWGIPYLTKLVQSVAYKHKLIRLDTQTIEGLINMITIFKIGSSDEKSPYHKVSPKRLRGFNALLKNPQASTMLVWPHDIDVITTGPDGKIMEFSDKYKDANADILRGMGVPPILIDGSGNSTAAWVTVIALVERLEKVRNQINNYYIHILKKICRENGFEDCNPTIRWSPTNLRDEKNIKTMLLAFYDRGLLPIKVMHEQGRYEHEEMIELKEIEKEEKLDELFMKPAIPFDSPNGQSLPGDDGGPGRPVDTVKTQDNQDQISTSSLIDVKDVNEKISAKFRDDIDSVLNKLEDGIISMNRRTKNKVDIMTLAQFKRIEQITQVFATFDSPDMDIEIDTKLNRWSGEHLDVLRKFVVSSVNKISRRKVDDEEKKIFIRGIFSEARRRAEMFINEAMRNIDIAKLITANKKDGNVGAIFRSNPNTKCETCADLDGNFLTMNEIFDTLPIHPNQHFTLEFTDVNPVMEGNKVNKTVVKNPKNKSKRL